MLYFSVRQSCTHHHSTSDATTQHNKESSDNHLVWRQRSVSDL